MYGVHFGNGFVYQLAFDWGSRSNTTFGKSFSSVMYTPTPQTVQFTNDRTSPQCSMINFKDRVWPSESGSVSTVSLVYKVTVCGKAVLLVSMRDFSG